jgi:hypothetical protein
MIDIGSTGVDVRTHDCILPAGWANAIKELGASE